MPLTKIAVQDGYQPFGMIFWQLIIGIVVLGGVLVARGRLRWFGPRQLLFCAMIALIGTLVPNATGYRAAFFLPSGIMAIVIAMVPMFAFPIAIVLGNDRFSWLKLFGLCLGVAGVLLLLAPEIGTPETLFLLFLPLALIAPFCYAIEGNLVARFGTFGLDPVEVLFGASVIGSVLAFGLAVGTGQFISPLPPYGAPDLALLASAIIHAVVYTVYVWLVGRAGAVFAAQVAYLVTGFGVIWSMIFLAERYSSWVWVALGLIFLGLTLVQPKPKLAHDADHVKNET